MRVFSVQYNYFPQKRNVEQKQFSFRSIANAGKLKTLFTYGLPCMYSGNEMIDPKRAQKLIKNGTFKKSSAEAIKSMQYFEPLITGIEAIVYQIIKKESAKQPDLTFQEILEYITPIFRKQLRKKQAPIFTELTELAQYLPDNARYKYTKLMDETNRKLTGKPIVIPFTPSDFKYKLEKARDDFSKRKEYKNLRVINKMLNECSRFYKETTPATIEHQKKVMNYLYTFFNRSRIRDNVTLKTLMETSIEQVNEKRVIIPFSRKAFIYDLSNILQKTPNKKLFNKMMTTAQTLPTSKEFVPAYIIKYSSEPSEKIGYRLLWPNFASVEHIKPKSCGGPDLMENFGGATAKENTDRQNIPFINQLIRKPKTPLFCQRYVDRLIELVENGIFKKNNIDTKYIDDFKSTIKKESKGFINLDTSRLKNLREKEPQLFTKPNDYWTS